MWVLESLRGVSSTIGKYSISNEKKNTHTHKYKLSSLLPSISCFMQIVVVEMFPFYFKIEFTIDKL